MTLDIHDERLLVLDFGSQYTQLIARRLREIGVYCEILPIDLEPEELRAFAPKGIILSGGPESVTTEAALKAPEQVFTAGVPVLGICYGMQTMAAQLGGQVVIARKHEFGRAQVAVTGDDQLLGGLHDSDGSLEVWMSHGDKVVRPPPGFKVTGSSANCEIAAMADESRRFYGVQFHPEVGHSQQGMLLLERFVKQLCGCQALWTPAKIAEDLVDSVREQVGDGKVLLGFSGGVDSTVVAALLTRALGEQLTCVFVDTGLLRQDEAAQVQALLGRAGGNALAPNLVMVDAEARFLQALAGITDPEEKRRIIGKTFIEVFDAEAAKIDGADFLAQGTIYPDVIESAAHGGKAHVIKSHHNVGGLPESMSLQLVEPLRELFKDEVRRLGLELGLSHEQVFRHPFPGPGLGIRIIGEVKQEYADLLRQADAIYMEELHEAGLYDQVGQAFAVFLPVKSVGVVGDTRRHAHVLALRAVETTDFMTARWSHLPYAFLERVSSRIINECPAISRVTYDISSKPPATIEWE